VLRSYRWPGNVRELKNFIQRVVLMADTELVKPEMLQPFLPIGASTTADGTLKAAWQRAEAETAERALAQAQGNVAEAAVIMGIAPSSLYRIMKQYGIATRPQIQTKA
jgi:DNA-binding NtrC family response regulator